jgi:hypothetical protein
VEEVIFGAAEDTLSLVLNNAPVRPEREVSTSQAFDVSSSLGAKHRRSPHACCGLIKRNFETGQTE